MGCAVSKNYLTPEEIRFSKGEDDLHYSGIDVEDIDLVHRKYSYNGTINTSQWDKISKKLSLRTSAASGTIPIVVTAFYESFSQFDEYDLQKLLVLGIFLGRGTGEVKARLLFEAFDMKDKKVLEKYELEDLYDTIYDVVVVKSKVLFNKDLPPIISTEDYNNYFDKLKAGSEAFKTEFLTLFLDSDEKTSITKFVEVFKDKNYSDLLSSVEFRKVLRKGGLKATSEESKNLSGSSNTFPASQTGVNKDLANKEIDSELKQTEVDASLTTNSKGLELEINETNKVGED